MLQKGDIFPDVLGPDANGNIIKLSDFPGKRFIIYFYPKDNTPGCTAEACSIRDGYEEFTENDFVVIGVSKDSEASHRKFAEKHSLPFILVADTDHKLCEQAGVWQLKKMAGREYFGIVRTTFIVGADGRVENVITKVNTKNAAEQLRQTISEQ